MDKRNWILPIALSILWGGSFFGEIALRTLQPLTLVLRQVGFAAPVLAGLLHALEEWLPARRHIPWGKPRH